MRGRGPTVAYASAMTDGSGSPERLVAWAKLHVAPLVASVALVALGLGWVLWWGAQNGNGSTVWATPPDLWSTYDAAVLAVHGHLAQVYSPATGLVTFPGIVVVLAPVAAVGSALHLEMGPNVAPYFAPTGWLLLGPYVLVLSTVPLFAVDAIARRFGVALRNRVVLSLTEAFVIANVTVKYGHPEDALAVGLALYGALAAEDGEWTSCAWLLGIAIAVQPLAVLAAPAIVARRGRLVVRLLPGLILPSAIVLAAPLAASWSAASSAITHQLNYPSLNFATPWTSIAPRVGSAGGVSAGPVRAGVTLLAFAAGAVLCRRRPSLEFVLFVIGSLFFARIVTEVVMDGYYPWAVVGIGVLLAARRGCWRLGASALLAIAVTLLGSQHWQGVWPWWLAVIGASGACLLLGWPTGAQQDTSPGQSHRASDPVVAIDA